MRPLTDPGQGLRAVEPASISHLWQHLTCLGAGLGAEGCSAGAHLWLRSSDQIWEACRCCTPVLSELCFVHALNKQATMAVHGSRCFHEQRACA